MRGRGRVLWVLPALVLAAVAAALGARAQAKGVPTLTVAVTANVKGVLESCGCGVIKYGGVPEKAQTLVDLRRKLGSALVVVDSGDSFSFGDGPGKGAALAQSLVLAGYQAVNFGDEEAAIGLGAMLAAAPPGRFPWVATNLRDRVGRHPLPTSRVIAAGGIRVGVLGVLPPEWKTGRTTSGGDEIVVEDPVAAVAREAAALRDKCQVLILLAHTDQALARRVVAAVPGITLVVGGEKVTEVPHAGALGSSYWVQGEGYSRNLVLVTLRQVAGKWRAVAAKPQRVVYKSKRYPPVARIASKYLTDSSKALEELISRTYGKSPLYEGDQKCLSCHPDEHAQWLTTRHPNGWETLKKAGHRYDPDCLDCHTTGEPGKPSTALKGVQCEACHGPFAKHGELPQTRPKTEAEWAPVCGRCHNEQRSPGFSVGKYLPRVKHKAPAPG